MWALLATTAARTSLAGFCRHIAKRRVRRGLSAVRTGCWPRNSTDGVSVSAIENAFVLAVTRCLVRPAQTPPLGTIRSLAYFLPVIEEVLDVKVGQDYFNYLRYRLSPYFPNMGKTPAGR